MTAAGPDRLALIRQRLASLEPSLLEVEDESHLHVGHEGARDGRGHFHVRIASARFRGLAALARHRLVYDALGDLLATDIHAVRITATA
ncbi:MAG: BolA family transcriptional regulator [Gammaproteobacteria bacterium]|nr:BolA family transcriptional regulator [Gammaproteobacteria bacterium]